MLFDTHAHLNDERYLEDLPQVFNRAKEFDVTRILLASFDEPSSRESFEMAKTDEHLFCSIGIHPHDASAFNDSVLDLFRAMIKERSDKVLAIGEIGLDYYHDLSPRDIQRTAFIKQIEFALECNLPFIVHDRDAHADCLEIIEMFARSGGLPENPGIFHCFSGSYEMAKILLNYGFYLSFAGPVTFKNAHKTMDFLPKIPLDRILIETDCPYLTPEPFRGKRNEPAYVRFVAERIAQILNLTTEEIADITYQNALRIFRLQ